MTFSMLKFHEFACKYDYRGYSSFHRWKKVNRSGLAIVFTIIHSPKNVSPVFSFVNFENRGVTFLGNVVSCCSTASGSFKVCK